MTFTLTIDGSITEPEPMSALVDLINRVAQSFRSLLPPSTRSIQSCDTCMVEVDGSWCALARESIVWNEISHEIH